MSRFDEYDAIAASGVAELLDEPIVWRPMRTTNRPYTGDESEPDPTRPVRNVTGIVTWRPSLTAIGTADPTGAVVVADCVVDFENAKFRDPDTGEWSLPRKGDIFELSEEYQGNNLVKIDNNGDDGSARLLFYCSWVS